jgi:hypothetical protein
MRDKAYPPRLLLSDGLFLWHFMEYLFGALLIELSATSFGAAMILSAIFLPTGKGPAGRSEQFLISELS